VAAELGQLPLGLDQAAAAIAGQGLRYAAYLAQLRALPPRQYSPSEEKQPYPSRVAEAVQLSLVAAQAADQAGVCTGVMEVVAVLSPAAVSRDVLRAAGQAGILASGGRRVAAPLVDEALARLEERSLLGFSLAGQAVIVHRLVARLVREALDRRGRLMAACRGAASALGASAEALAERRDQAAVRDLLAQATALLNNGRGSLDQADEELARMLMRMRFVALSHLIELGDNMPQAIAIGERLTTDLELLLGPEHPDTLNARNSLAAAYQAAGRAAEAIPLFEQTLAGRERLLGPDHPDTTRSRNDLVGAYRNAGRATEALPLLEQVLAARERILGIDHPGTLAPRNNLAATYRAAGRAAEAIPLFEQNLTACERLLGTDHPRTEATRRSLAGAREEMARAEGRAGPPGAR
jgi:tetratricopeptide (TPR) repeat protein